ncbi:MAG: hypothetical protein PWQ38_383 [Proteiniphilum sp.]|jgi:hypothetical protein|nr:hypothetical protein [Proteiniphilum sp.]
MRQGTPGTLPTLFYKGMLFFIFVMQGAPQKKAVVNLDGDNRFYYFLHP